MAYETPRHKEAVKRAVHAGAGAKRLLESAPSRFRVHAIEGRPGGEEVELVQLGDGLSPARGAAAVSPAQEQPPAGSSSLPLPLLQQAQLIRNVLELSPDHSIPATLRKANELMGITNDDGASLPEQAARLMQQLGI